MLTKFDIATDGKVDQGRSFPKLFVKQKGGKLNSALFRKDRKKGKSGKGAG